MQCFPQPRGGISTIRNILTIVAPEIRRYPNLLRIAHSQKDQEFMKEKFLRIFNDNITGRQFLPIFGTKFSDSPPKLVSFSHFQLSGCYYHRI
jgi:hypothetical protein